jgi:predicted component of type VI protein secretion system
MATSSYLIGQKSKYRVTLELDVMEDFNPHQIDWNKVLDLQGSERARSYIENLSSPDRW